MNSSFSFVLALGLASAQKGGSLQGVCVCVHACARVCVHACARVCVCDTLCTRLGRGQEDGEPREPLLSVGTQVGKGSHRGVRDPEPELKGRRER